MNTEIGRPSVDEGNQRQRRHSNNRRNACYSSIMKGQSPGRGGGFCAAPEPAPDPARSPALSVLPLVRPDKEESGA